MPKERDWSDIEMLTILDLSENEGLTYDAIAERFNATKGSIAGLIHRTRKVTDASDPTGCQNGTMPRKWWAR